MERCAAGPTVAIPDDGHPFQIAELILPAHDQVATPTAIVDDRCHVHPQLVVVSRFDVLLVIAVGRIAPEERRRDGVACPIAHDEQVPSVVRSETRAREAHKAIAGVEIHGRVDHQRQVFPVGAHLESDQGVVDLAEGHLDRRAGTVDVLPRERSTLGDRASAESNLQLTRCIERDRTVVAQANCCGVDFGFDRPGAAQDLAFRRVINHIDPGPDIAIGNTLEFFTLAQANGTGLDCRLRRNRTVSALEPDIQRVNGILHLVATLIEPEMMPPGLEVKNIGGTRQGRVRRSGKRELPDQGRQANHETSCQRRQLTTTRTALLRAADPPQIRFTRNVVKRARRRVESWGHHYSFGGGF